MTKPIELISLVHSPYWSDRMFIPEAIQKSVEPYLLPYDHPVREKLDQIFAKSIESLELLSRGDEVTVYAHDALKGFVVKIPNSLKKPSKLLRRVEGHHAANRLIHDKNYTHVRVTQNWLYPLLASDARALPSQESKDYADKILKEHFIVVEERVKIEKVTHEQLTEQLNASETALVDECFDLALEVGGIHDLHDENYCFDQDGKLVFFDFGPFSRKKEKRIDLDIVGAKILFRDSDHKDYAVQKRKTLLPS